MGKEKILIVHNYYQLPGGEDTVVANEKKMLESNGHEVILYSRNNSELIGLSKRQKLLLPFTTVFNIKTYKDVKRIIQEKNIQILHVHNTLSLISPSVYYAALKCKIPVVQTIHNFRMLCPGATFYRDGNICEECIKLGLKCAVKYKCYRNNVFQTLACVINIKLQRMAKVYSKLNFICLTEFNKKKLLLLKQISPEQIFVKPNFAVNLNSVIPIEKRKNQFVFAGRLEKLKGIDILLKAWHLMGQKAPKLLICGTGPMKTWCRQYIISHKLETVELKGFIPNDDVYKIISVSKALILPTQCYEGFPMSIIEAYSVGTPVIASDLGNAGSIVVEGVSGSKFRFNSPKELVKAVQRLEKYKNIIASTDAEYRKHYTEKTNYECLMSIYQAIQQKPT